MAGTIDTGLEFFRQILALRAYRQEILSADIANASTPGFKAVDLDFSGALGAATAKRPGSDAPAAPKRIWLVDNDRHLPGGASNSDAVGPQFVEYQTGNEVTLDGNSVDLDHEKVSAAANAVQYEAAATFASQLVRMMMVAITGSASSQQSSGS